MMMAASSMWAGCEPTWVPWLRVMRVVPSCCQRGPWGTMAMPTLPLRLVGSRASWNTPRKLFPSYSHPPSTYMVYCGGRWRFCRGLVVGVAAKVSRWGGGSGVFIGVMERIRWCRPCGWDSALGCRRILCHVMVRCRSRFAVVRIGGGAVAGLLGVHLYWSPWSGCAWECGLIGCHARR